MVTDAEAEAEPVRPRSSKSEHHDGRVARGHRTRLAILDAYDRLIREAEVPPTGSELAAEAGVSARSVFTHFGDMDGVLAGAAERALEWLTESHVQIGQELPLAERIDLFSARQAEVLERTAPLYRMTHGPRRSQRRSSKVSDALSKAEKVRRAYLRHLFEGELREADGAGDTEMFEALMTGTSWGAWDSLRVEQELDASRARAVLRRVIIGMLR